MTDYKDIINNLLRHYPDEYWALQAVEAIVRLTNKYDCLDEFNDAICKEYRKVKKERDAAVADFNQFAIYAASTESFACEWCKHERGGGRCQWFTDHKDDRVCRGVHFEWRGLREDGE